MTKISKEIIDIDIRLYILMESHKEIIYKMAQSCGLTPITLIPFIDKYTGKEFCNYCLNTEKEKANE